MNIYIYPHGIPVLVAAVSRFVCAIFYEKKKKEMLKADSDAVGQRRTHDSILYLSTV